MDDGPPSTDQTNTEENSDENGLATMANLIVANDPTSIATIPAAVPPTTTTILVNDDNNKQTPAAPQEQVEVEEPMVVVNGTPADDASDTESDALVIDEKSEVTHGFNPYFGESLYELSQQHHHVEVENKTSSANNNNNNNTKKSKPRLREYAQYLGLQPSVQFKCSKCGRAGFDTLLALNQHLVQCVANNNDLLLVGDDNNSAATAAEIDSLQFKLSRRVFLCSPCGTYYEKWNLYLHMLEVHRRFVCLYCLGMFSVLNDLCAHIEKRHHVEPGHRDTEQEFFHVYNQPCYLTCCECNKLFNEQDDFFHHNCNDYTISAATNNTSSRRKLLLNNNNSRTLNNILIRPDNHVTGENSIGKGVETGPMVPASDRTDDNYYQTEIPPINVNHYESSDSEPDFKGFEEIQPLLQESVPDLPNNAAKMDVSEDVIEEAASTNNNNNTADDRSTPPLAIPPPLSSGDHHNDDDDDDDEEDDDDEDDDDEEENDDEDVEPFVETRKVPKLSLKLKPGSFPEIEQIPLEDDDYYDDDDDDDENTDAVVPEIIEKPPPLPVAEIDDNIEPPPAPTPPLPLEDEEDKALSSINNTDNSGSMIQIAGPDVQIIELKLEHPLDKFDIRQLVQKCLNSTVPTCIYCNHARRIAVNGKQLGLHAIAEHRYSAVVSSITAEELIPESFVARIRDSLDELDGSYLNLECNFNTNSEACTFSHQFECFQCRYSTTIHKELYLHNRKLHTKNLLLCIMCKSNFYTYSELICHLCPGIYILNHDVEFRCCLCFLDNNTLPSAFRLMVHLRKRHHVCDVCLESCHSQYKLSNHVWKHKLHHFCYRCGIAYRNKPDITRHLFWKHGTESVLCKKCLQKKWPHVYHFCVPPAHFNCDECNLSFGRAVALKVHKRVHSDTKPHQCQQLIRKKPQNNDDDDGVISEDLCGERFISKKLLAKHELQVHQGVDPEVPDDNNQNDDKETTVEDDESLGVAATTTLTNSNDNGQNKEDAIMIIDDVIVCEATTMTSTTTSTEAIIKPTKKVDVYDLPALNLSEESDSDDDQHQEDDNNRKLSPKELISVAPTVDDENIEETNIPQITTSTLLSSTTCVVPQPPPPPPPVILENIWDNFKNYQATKSKFDHLLFGGGETQSEDAAAASAINQIEVPFVLTAEIALQDHDYLYKRADVSFTEMTPELNQSVDHDYCSAAKPDHDDTGAATTTTATTKISSSILVDNDEAATDKSVNNNTNDNNNNNNNNTSGDSGDDSDSSCSCGSNCSCSTSSADGGDGDNGGGGGGIKKTKSSTSTASSTSDSSDSDSSTAEGRRRQQLRRNRRSTKRSARKNNNVISGGKKPSSLSLNTNNKNNNKKIVTEATKTNIATTVMKLPPVDQPIFESDLDTSESDTDEEFYDRQPQKVAEKLLEEKRNQLLLSGTGGGLFDENNSRSMTPNLVVCCDDDDIVVVDNNAGQQPQQQLEETNKSKKSTSGKVKKSKSKKKKKKKDNKNSSNYHRHHNNNYNHQHHQHHQYQQPTVAPITLSRISSPIPPTTNIMSITQSITRKSFNSYDNNSADSDSNLRASKRRRVPNKFYGYSSDEDLDRVGGGGGVAGMAITKWRKTSTGGGELPLPQQSQQQNHPLIVPPITIKTSLPTSIQPFSIRNSNTIPQRTIAATSSIISGSNHYLSSSPAANRISTSSVNNNSINNNKSSSQQQQHQQKYINNTTSDLLPDTDNDNNDDDSSDDNNSDDDDDDNDNNRIVKQSTMIANNNRGGNIISNHHNNAMPDGVNPNALYCYCKCPYDEVSEMIGCDSRDCNIEWFHFECVGIMVPPKGHWYCPECRKKRQQQRLDLLKMKVKTGGPSGGSSGSSSNLL